ncbi:hypothetical protein JCM10213_008587 [Rhodosporidiobolus nylandii]
MSNHGDGMVSPPIWKVHGYSDGQFSWEPLYPKYIEKGTWRPPLTKPGEAGTPPYLPYHVDLVGSCSTPILRTPTPPALPPALTPPLPPLLSAASAPPPRPSSPSRIPPSAAIEPQLQRGKRKTSDKEQRREEKRQKKRNEGQEELATLNKHIEEHGGPPPFANESTWGVPRAKPCIWLVWTDGKATRMQKEDLLNALLDGRLVREKFHLWSAMAIDGVEGKDSMELDSVVRSYLEAAPKRPCGGKRVEMDQSATSKIVTFVDELFERYPFVAFMYGRAASASLLKGLSAAAALAQGLVVELEDGVYLEAKKKKLVSSYTPLLHPDLSTPPTLRPLRFDLLSLDLRGKKNFPRPLIKQATIDECTLDGGLLLQRATGFIGPEGNAQNASSRGAGGAAQNADVLIRIRGRSREEEEGRNLASEILLGAETPDGEMSKPVVAPAAEYWPPPPESQLLRRCVSGHRGSEQVQEVGENWLDPFDEQQQEYGGGFSDHTPPCASPTSAPRPPSRSPSPSLDYSYVPAYTHDLLSVFDLHDRAPGSASFSSRDLLFGKPSSHRHSLQHTPATSATSSPPPVAPQPAPSSRFNYPSIPPGGPKCPSFYGSSQETRQSFASYRIHAEAKEREARQEKRAEHQERVQAAQAKVAEEATLAEATVWEKEVAPEIDQALGESSGELRRLQERGSVHGKKLYIDQTLLIPYLLVAEQLRQAGYRVVLIKAAPRLLRLARSVPKGEDHGMVFLVPVGGVASGQTAHLAPALIQQYRYRDNESVHREGGKDFIVRVERSKWAWRFYRFPVPLPDLDPFWLQEA